MIEKARPLVLGCVVLAAAAAGCGTDPAVGKSGDESSTGKAESCPGRVIEPPRPTVSHRTDPFVPDKPLRVTLCTYPTSDPDDVAEADITGDAAGLVTYLNSSESIDRDDKALYRCDAIGRHGVVVQFEYANVDPVAVGVWSACGVAVRDVDVRVINSRKLAGLGVE